MNKAQLEKMHKGQGFIAALDQSGGSTPKALLQYGIQETAYTTDEEMFALVHQMRTRIITSPSFSSTHILAAILFEDTMERMIEGRESADYLWEVKGIIPILKIDKGLAEIQNGVQLMKDIPHLDDLLERAKEHHIFGTKMRSVIKKADPEGIKQIVDQQFKIGKQIAVTGLVPILEPEVDIHIADKKEAEILLKAEINKQLSQLDKDIKLMFKVSIPSEDNFYEDLMSNSHVVRVVALSGGYAREEANALLSKNHRLIASFSRALAQDLRFQQSNDEFNGTLKNAIESIYKASIA